MEPGEVKQPSEPRREVKPLSRLKEDTDSDFSPEGGPKIPKHRKAVRRTKSALETTCELHPRRMKHSLEDLHNSLPTRLFTQEESDNEIEAKQMGSGILRPTRKRSRKRKGEKEDLDEMKIVDLEGLDDGRVSPFKQRIPTPHCRKKQLISDDLDKRDRHPVKYGRSVSVDERIIPFRPRLLTPDSNSLKKIKKSNLDGLDHQTMPTKNVDSHISDHIRLFSDLPRSSDVTPRSHGQDIPSVNMGEVSVNVRKRHKSKPKPRPSSAGDIKSIQTSHDGRTILPSKGGSLKEPPVNSRIVKMLRNGSESQEVTSHQSSTSTSTFGLGGLFSTDSDSSDEGG